MLLEKIDVLISYVTFKLVFTFSPTKALFMSILFNGINTGFVIAIKCSTVTLEMLRIEHRSYPFEITKPFVRKIGMHIR